MYSNRGQMMSQQQHHQSSQMTKEEAYTKDEVMKEHPKTHENIPEPKVDDETIKKLCNAITSMYFEAEQHHRMMKDYTRVFKTENGKARLNKYFYDCYVDIGCEIAKEIADHMEFNVDYFRQPEPIKKYDFNMVEGHKEYWHDLLNNEEYLYHEMQEYAKILHDAGYYPFYEKIVKIMKKHKEHKMRIKYVIRYLEQYDYANWILEKVNRIIHDHLEEHEDLDFSL